MLSIAVAGGVLATAAGAAKAMSWRGARRDAVRAQEDAEQARQLTIAWRNVRDSAPPVAIIHERLLNAIVEANAERQALDVAARTAWGRGDPARRAVSWAEIDELNNAAHLTDARGQLRVVNQRLVSAARRHEKAVKTLRGLGDARQPPPLLICKPLCSWQQSQSGRRRRCSFIPTV